MSYVTTWIALMALLALTTASAFIPLGAWNSVINLVIAAVKALLVALFFMQLRRASGLTRLVAAVGLFMLALLFGLSGGDYLTRHPVPAAWVAPR
ncbi:MAG TPA: cytochrome C oxidase subunit IV family protein [Burkholderiales bacterium]|jgi:cytochrome c oxidase subunit 4|nr:cytochrome C oxidase subunit IV family protein [Burkholderiales bacterium]